MSPDLSVVIVNFNAGPGLAACLSSLARGLRGLSWHAVVVDNASTDGSGASAENAGAGGDAAAAAQQCRLCRRGQSRRA